MRLPSLGDATLALAPIVPAVAARAGIRRTLADARGVAITFDDGPHPEGTPAILEILAAANVNATFFLVGEQVERRPALAAEIRAAGHTVALHGYRHRSQALLTSPEIEDDYRRGTGAVQEATGITPTLHRPPYGVYSVRGLSAARAAGLRPLLWSQWGKDWRQFTTPGRIARRVTGRLTPGDVILLHDADFYSSQGSHQKTVAALPIVIAELKRRELGTVLPV